MNKIFEAWLHFNSDDDYVLASTEENTLDDFLAIYENIIVDESYERHGSDVADVVAKKLSTRDFNIDLDFVGEEQYIIITINVETN